MAVDLHPVFGIFAGSITQVDGHGSGAAYAERFAEVYNLQSVMELSMTAATIGLIVGGILAGPVAQFLIARHRLSGENPMEARLTGVVDEPVGAPAMIRALAGVLRQAALRVLRALDPERQPLQPHSTRLIASVVPSAHT